jgi:hypothetical protein
MPNSASIASVSRRSSQFSLREPLGQQEND